MKGLAVDDDALLGSHFDTNRNRVILAANIALQLPKIAVALGMNVLSLGRAGVGAQDDLDVLQAQGVGAILKPVNDSLAAAFMERVSIAEPP